MPRLKRFGNIATSCGAAAVICAISMCLLAPSASAQATVSLTSGSGLSAQLDPATGNYRIVAANPHWIFSGTLTGPAGNAQKTSGQDRIGAYQQVVFTWQDGNTPVQGTIRLYQSHPVLLFEYKYLKATSPATVFFPSFTSIPRHLHHFSYKDQAFSPPQFTLGQYSTPWLLFDDQADAAVISPASHFIIAAMHGDGDHLIESGLNAKLRGVPDGFTQRTLMVIAPGIRHGFDTWGSALIALSGKTRPGNESDVILKDYGYWTDNGAVYYYRFDPKLGYTGTLKAVLQNYRDEKIPVRYLQLDSWWYDKAYPGMPPTDKLGTWKAFGGIMRFRADPSLFPEGLGAFDKSIGGLPLIVHSRWISRQSPDHENYQISGVAPVGPKWWNDTAQYLSSNGVITYEQDWQSYITPQSPAFSETVDAGDKFYDNMARSSQSHHMTMQYCMALPADFLEGSQYGNLTSIRSSDDRFSRPRWRDFLYVSQLAYAIGSWPWADVYFSHETDNMLLATLSAGPVGTGDALGAEDKSNIMKAVRADGVIVKPDVPLMPLDQMYIQDATPLEKGTSVQIYGGAILRRNQEPFVASTWTDDGSLRTSYVFAFSHSPEVYQTVHFTPEQAGTSSPASVYNYFAHTVSQVEKGQTFKSLVGPGETGYYIVAPTGPSGIALFGDLGKFASMGKQRIASVEEAPHSVTAQVLFGAGDNSVTLFGDAPSAPSVTVQGGSAGSVSFRQRDGYFTVRIQPGASTTASPVNGEPVRRVTVKLTLAAK